MILDFELWIFDLEKEIKLRTFSMCVQIYVYWILIYFEINPFEGSWQENFEFLF